MSSWLLQFVDCTVYTIVFTKTWALKYKMNPRLLLKIHLLTCLFKYDRKLTPHHGNFIHWKIRLCTTFRISGAQHKTNALKKLLKLFPNWFAFFLSLCHNSVGSGCWMQRKLTPCGISSTRWQDYRCGIIR